MPAIYKRIASLLIDWPWLIFIFLQISVILACEYQSSFFFIFLIFLILVLAFLHFYTNHLYRFIVFIFILFLSVWGNQFVQKPLSQNLSTKNATYKANVLSTAEFSDDITRTTIDLVRRILPVEESVSGRIQISISGYCEIPVGSEIIFSAKIKPPQAYKNPGVFDYRTYLRRQNIWGKAFVQDCKEIQINQKREMGWIQSQQSQFLKDLTQDKVKNGPLLKALLFGSRAIGKEQKDFFKIAGLSHLLAISGMNFAMMGILIYALVIFFTNFFPKIYLTIPKQKIASVFTLLFIIYYLLLVDHQASLLRAGIMMICYLTAIIFERQKHVLNIILISACLLLLFRPQDLFQLSFQLSYLCVLILAIILPSLQKYWEENPLWKKLPKLILYFLQILLVSWLLQILLLPVVAFEFGTLPLAGLINNLWAIPFFDFVLVPLSLAYFISFSFSLPFAQPILEIWDSSVSLFIQIIQVFSQIKIPKLNLPALQAEQVFCFYVFIFLFFLLRRKILLVAMAVLLTISFTWTYYQNHLSYDWRLTQIDVGQGDAILLQTKKKNWLIDTGGHMYFDLASQVLMPFFKNQGVSHLDSVVITHGDFDHYGAMSSLLDQISVGEVWINDKLNNQKTYLELLEKIKTRKIPLKQVYDESWVNVDDILKIHILSPNPLFSELNDDNDHSIVMQIFDKRNSGDIAEVLLTGDLSKNGEKFLLTQYGEQLKSKVLKIGHHGSRSSTSVSFLNSVSPQLTLIGVGEQSRFGHPAKQVIELIKERQIPILRTDLNGAIQISMKNRKLTHHIYNSFVINP